MSESSGLSVLVILLGAAVTIGCWLLKKKFHEEEKPHENKRSHNSSVKRQLSCPKCLQVMKTGDHVLTFLCGHVIHEMCLYDDICEKEKVVDYPCPDQRCSRIIEKNILLIVLLSRCGACKKHFDNDSKLLDCGHKLHKKCLEADFIRQYCKEGASAYYKCPYKVLNCNQTMPRSKVKEIL